MSTNPGELPVTLTFLKPATPFDQWNGWEWVTDKAALKASQTVSILKDAVELGLETEAEKASLPAWKEYRVRLYRTDMSKAPDIE